MRIVMAIAVLCLAGCTTQTPGKGNEPTYSGNSQGNRNSEILRQCAGIAYAAFKQNPNTDADAMFRACVRENTQMI